jgi:hypothetical protein
MLWGGVLAFLPSPATAQDVLGAQRRQATRAEIEQAITSAEQVAATADSKTRESCLRSRRARVRLRTVIAPGDRLFMRVLNDSSLTDTITVRNEQKISSPTSRTSRWRGAEFGLVISRPSSKYLKDPRCRRSDWCG